MMKPSKWLVRCGDNSGFNFRHCCCWCVKVSDIKYGIRIIYFIN